MRTTVVRILLSIAVAAMGVVDLLSALLSHPDERLQALTRLVPTDVLDTSRTFTLIAGALLLVTAWGLRRGKRRAFVAALLLCALSVPVNMLKALDVEEASTAAGLMFLLGVSGDAFRVRSREVTLQWLRSWGAAAVAGLLAYAAAGCWMVENIFGPDASVQRAVAEAGYRLFGVGGPTLVLSRSLTVGEMRVIQWFLESLPVLGLVLLVALAVLALRPAAHVSRHRQEARHVADLIQAHGDSTVAWFALAADTDYFFSPNRRAVIAYRFEGDTLLAVGDPIGPDEELPALLRAFEQHCRSHDWRFAFFQARPERLALYQSLGWRSLHLGEDPVLWTDRFTLEGSAIAEVRRAVRRVEGAGVTVRLFFPGEGAFDPRRDEDGLLEQMREISNEWMRTRHGGEKGFCMGRFDPAHLHETPLAVAWNAEKRRVEAFVTWVPIPARRGWALDLMRRRADSVTGVMEFLVVKTLEAARARGDALLSLSLSALVSVEDPPLSSEAAEAATVEAEAAVSPLPATAARPRPAPPPAEAPRTADRAREFLMEHLSRFYDFKNLFRWKKKFAPAFEDRFLVYPEPLALPRVALALARAQSPGGLLAYFRRG
jgi:phosphatidylglycerol lysyltransferase